MGAYRRAVKAGSELSLASQAFLAKKKPGELGEWFTALMRHSRTVFQPWSMEIIFVTGVLGHVRFSQLEDLLGTSSRTLSNKLRSLAAAGLLQRHVEGGPPLRTTYTLTKQGRATAALSSPLFAHLNLVAVQTAAKPARTT